MFSYGINRRSRCPFRLYLCGLLPDLERCLERISGYKNWLCYKSVECCSSVFGLPTQKHYDSSSDGTEDASSLKSGSIGQQLRMEGTIQDHGTPTYEEQPIISANKLVYLTADSDDVLESLEPSYGYIIGGLVDRNRYPRITADRARLWGIKTARLPIQDYYRLGGSKVLTVNQGEKTLLKYTFSN